ncbi:MAG: 8-oxo-dGTP diphosphatase [Myxococcota bacterium]
MTRAPVYHHPDAPLSPAALLSIRRGAALPAAADPKKARGSDVDRTGRVAGSRSGKTLFARLEAAPFFLVAPSPRRGSAISNSNSHATSVGEINWEQWTPVDVGTLCFIRVEGSLLLIRKKRGLGAGKIVAPGGRLEAGESILECVLREVKEEVGVDATDPQARGDLHFQFRDGYSIRVHVFACEGFTGNVCESEEALPLWTPIEAIPYEEMWADDALWLPELLADRCFTGYYVFDGDQMLDHDTKILG